MVNYFIISNKDKSINNEELLLVKYPNNAESGRLSAATKRNLETNSKPHETPDLTNDVKKIKTVQKTGLEEIREQVPTESNEEADEAEEALAADKEVKRITNGAASDAELNPEPIVSQYTSPNQVVQQQNGINWIPQPYMQQQAHEYANYRYDNYQYIQQPDPRAISQNVSPSVTHPQYFNVSEYNPYAYPATYSYNNSRVIYTPQPQPSINISPNFVQAQQKTNFKPAELPLIHTPKPAELPLIQSPVENSLANNNNIYVNQYQYQEMANSIRRQENGLKTMSPHYPYIFQEQRITDSVQYNDNSMALAASRPLAPEYNSPENIRYFPTGNELHDLERSVNIYKLSDLIIKSKSNSGEKLNTLSEQDKSDKSTQCEKTATSQLNEVNNYNRNEVASPCSCCSHQKCDTSHSNTDQNIFIDTDIIRKIEIYKQAAEVYNKIDEIMKSASPIEYKEHYDYSKEICTLSPREDDLSEFQSKMYNNVCETAVVYTNENTSIIGQNQELIQQVETLVCQIEEPILVEEVAVNKVDEVQAQEVQVEQSKGSEKEQFTAEPLKTTIKHEEIFSSEDETPSKLGFN